MLKNKCTVGAVYFLCSLLLKCPKAFYSIHQLFSKCLQCTYGRGRWNWLLMPRRGGEIDWSPCKRMSKNDWLSWGKGGYKHWLEWDGGSNKSSQAGTEWATPTSQGGSKWINKWTGYLGGSKANGWWFMRFLRSKEEKNGLVAVGQGGGAGSGNGCTDNGLRLAEPEGQLEQLQRETYCVHSLIVIGYKITEKMGLWTKGV